MTTTANPRLLPPPLNASQIPLRGVYEPFMADLDILATDTTNVTLAPGKPDYTFFVTHVSGSILTSAAQSIILQDTTGLVIVKSPVSAPVGPMFWEFGEDGTSLTPGAGPVIALSGAGVAGRVHLEGYWRPTVAAVGRTRV